MKRFISVVFSLLIILCVALPCYAEETESGAKVKAEGDVVTLSYSLDSAEAKKAVDSVLEELLKTHTRDEIAAIPGLGEIFEEIGLFARFTFNGFVSCIRIPEGPEEVSFSLYDDIIPGFSAEADFSQGGEIQADIIPATASFPSSGALSFSSLSQKADGTISVPKTGRIVFDIPEEAQNNNPSCFELPLKKDIVLEFPTMPGNTFTGWTTGETAIASVPAGTENIVVKANFEPKVYTINYVLTTDITYSFGRADNSKNPQTYTYGVTQPLYSIKSPVGGYTFFGWYLNGELVNEIPAGTIGAVVLYAKWIDDETVGDFERAQTLKKIKAEYFADIDADGKVSVSDARSVLRMAVGLESFSNAQKRRADVLGTGVVTVSNARTILRLAIGLDDIVEVYYTAQEVSAN